MMNKLKFFLVVALGTVAASLRAQVPPIDKNGLAVGGYDVVAYFSNKAVKGDSRYTARYEKGTYYFSNAENRDAFKKNPQQYLPQFEGYCAWGVAAKDSKFPVNPETFKVVDNKLYLFFNGPLNGSNFNTIEPWNKDESNLLKAAHTKWPTVKGKK